jgi:hypothetical protein
LLEAINKQYQAELAKTPPASVSTHTEQPGEQAKTDKAGDGAAAQPVAEANEVTGKLIKLAAEIDTSVKDGATLTAAVELAGKRASDAADARVATKNELDTLLAEPGIVVTNWTRKVNVSADAQATDAASANYAREKEIHGYLVMAGLRTATLVPGKDLLYAYKDTDGDPVSRVKKSRLFVTQYTQSAKYLAWAESRFSSVEAGLQASVDQLLAKWKSVGEIKDLTKVLEAFPVQIGGQYASNLATSNTGSIANGLTAAYRFSITPGEYEQAWLAALKRSSGYRTIYSSRATLLGLMAVLRGDDANCADASACNSRCPPGNFYDANLIQ